MRLYCRLTCIARWPKISTTERWCDVLQSKDHLSEKTNNSRTVGIGNRGWLLFIVGLHCGPLDIIEGCGGNDGLQGASKDESE